MKDLPGQGANKAAGNLVSIPVDVTPGRRTVRKTKNRTRERLAKASRKRNRR